ncbi:putative protein OS=Streptomyces microflavus OX=1919 GN=Smic_30310 PE=4 SV=1 [Streptomyces microflavus]
MTAQGPETGEADGRPCTSGSRPTCMATSCPGISRRAGGLPSTARLKERAVFESIPEADRSHRPGDSEALVQAERLSRRRGFPG